MIYISHRGNISSPNEKFEKKYIRTGKSKIKKKLVKERWPSGLRRMLGKCVCCKRYPGFESLSLRH
jgi:hypothetical protein